MGHDVVQRGGLGARTLDLLPSSLPLWPFSPSFFSSALSPRFLFSCCSSPCSTPLSMEHERAGPWPDLHWWFIGLINRGL